MNLRVCICAIAKNENLYIREWIEHHKRLGFDKIFVYDNNDPGDEKIIDVTQDYVADKYIEVVDVRGQKSYQPKAYTDCYKRNRDKFDWFLFIDIDEFLVLEDKNNIKDILSDSRYDHCDIIRVNWKHFTDNDVLDVVNNDYSVFTRFVTRVKYFKDTYGKSFIRSTVDIKDSINAHGYCHEFNYPAYNTIGEKCYNTGCQVSYKPLYKIMWLNHYRTKTIGEYIRQKYFRGDASGTKNRYNNLEYFFDSNTKTQEKVDYALNLIKIIDSNESNNCVNNLEKTNK